MNWVDLVVLILLLMFVLDGLGRGFIAELLDFFAFFLAFLFALRFYNYASIFFQQNFQLPYSVSNVIGFITVWFLVESILFSLIRLAFIKIEPLSEINSRLRFLSFLPALLRGLVFVAILLVLVATFPIQPKIKLAVEHSKIASVILRQSTQLETPLKNIFGEFTQETLTFLTIKPQSNETVNLGFQTTEFRPNPQLEEEMIKLVNQERIKVGLPQLAFNNSLRDIARSHSTDMFTRGYFSHYSPEGDSVADRAEKYGYSYQVIGENLAYAPNLQLAHQGLMNSPGHRANILSPEFKKIGIGIMDGGVYGLMITQVFSD